MEEKHLETASADNPVWLVKVPKFLAAKWKEFADGGSGSILGTIKFKSDAPQPSGVAPDSFTLELPEGTEGLPVTYQVNEMGSGADHTHMFSSTDDRESSLTGKVAKRFDVRPQRSLTEKSAWDSRWGKVDIDPTYCKLSRQRYAAANQKHRTLKKIDDQEGRIATLATMKYTGKRPMAIPGGPAPSSMEQKRVRIDKEELENLLFTLFEKKPQWSFSGLVEETNQPTAWLKEVLLGVAALNKKGANKGTYELKPEYAVNKPAES